MSVSRAGDRTVTAGTDRLAFVRADQTGRWRGGDRKLAEAYFAEFPALRGRPEDALVLIAGEMALRAEAGEAVDAADFAARFPDLAEPLRLQAALAPLMAADPAARPDVPGYALLAEIGRGAMGVVYRAHQAGLNRSVAVKLLRVGFAGPDAAARFRLEAEAVARLSHANIVGVFDVGEAADGTPYLAMECVDGPTLAHWAGNRAMPPLAAAALVETLAAAVDHAHARGVVHRDLKPANVLLAGPTATDCGVVKIADFGLARVLENESGLTATEAFLGTPAYMSPEQAAGGSKAAGPAADVYALGAILYELLTGRPPFRAGSVLQLLRKVAEQEPVPPSTLVPRLPRDLETVCLKCLAKEPAGRYATAADLADDLGRLRAGEPVRARPLGPWGRLVKWARRYPAVAGLAATTALLLVAVAAVSTVAAVRLNAALDATRDAKREAGVRLAESLIEQADANRLSRRPGQRFESVRRLQEAARVARENDALPRLAARLRDTAVAALALADLEPADDLAPAGPVAVDPAFETLAHLTPDGVCHVVRLADRAELYRVAGIKPGHLIEVTAGGAALIAYGVEGRVWAAGSPVATLPSATGCCVRPDGREAAFVAEDGTVTILHLPSGRVRARLPAVGVSQQASVALAPDGATVALCSYHTNRVLVCDAATGAVVADLPHPAGADGIAYAPDGATLATAGNDSRLRVWDAKSHALRRAFGPCDGGTRLRFAAGGLLVGRGWGGAVLVWDATTGGVVASSPPVLHAALTLGPAGDKLVAGDRDRLSLWRLADGRECRPAPSHGRVSAGTVACHPGGRLVAAGTGDSIRLWDAVTGAESDALAVPGGSGACITVAFDGAGALVASTPAGVLRWPVRGAGDRLALGPPEQLADVPTDGCDISRDGRVLAFGVRCVSAREPYSGAWVRRLDGPARPRRLSPGAGTGVVALAPDGRCLVGPHPEVSGLRAWDVRAGRPAGLIPIPELHAMSAATFSPCGRWAHVTQTNHVWRLADTHAEWRRAATVAPASFRVAFPPAGDRLALPQGHGLTVIVDPATGADLARLADPGQGGGPVAWTADGGRLVATTQLPDAALRVWDLRLIRDRLAAAGLDAAPFPAPPGPTAADPPPLTARWIDGPPTPPAETAADRALTAGEAAIAAGRWDDAVRELVAVTDPQLADEASRLRALADRRAGRPAMLPTSEFPPAAWYFWDGYVAHDRGRHRLAAALYAEAVHHAPDDPKATHMLARVLATGPADVRDLERALPLAERAVQLRPNRPLMLHTLGAAQRATGRFAEAITTLRTGLTFASPDWDGLLLTELALALHDANDAGAAEAAATARAWPAASADHDMATVPKLFRDDMARLRRELDGKRP